MTSRTAQRKQAEAQPRPEVEPGPPPEVEGPRWASKDDLGPEVPYEDHPLPRLGMMVRIRYLETPEVMRLQFLPDYADYLSLAVELSKGGDPEMSQTDMANLAERTTRYQAMVAHLTVLDPDADPEPIGCEACGGTHPPSMWGPHQAARLSPPDLDFITGVAMRMKEVMEAIPFSGGQPPSDTPSPAGSGESIPEPN